MPSHHAAMHAPLAHRTEYRRVVEPAAPLPDIDSLERVISHREWNRTVGNVGESQRGHSHMKQIVGQWVKLPRIKARSA
jgi:hypothetical protein